MGILDAIMQSAVAGALRDTQDWLNRQAQGQGTVGGPAAPLVQRAAQDVTSQFADTLPNPLAGAGIGPAEVHYNPLRNVPVVGGLINTTVNGPLHALGNTQELAQQAAQGIGGEAALAAAAAQVGAANAGWVDPNNTATQASRATLAQGAAHPGRAIAAMRSGPDSTDAWVAGLLELAANPLNYAGGLGEAGRGLQAAGEAAPALRAIGTGLEGAGGALEAVNQAYALPFHLPAQARAALAEAVASVHPGPQALADALNAGTAAAPPDVGQATRYATGDVPANRLLPGVGRNGGKGLGPALLPTMEQAALDLPMVPGAGDYRRAAIEARGAQLQPLPRGAGPSALAVPKDFDIIRAAQAQRAATLVQPASDLLGAARQSAQPNPLEQMLGAARNVAARDVPLPLRAESGDLPLPELGAITPAEELAAKESALAPNVSVPDQGTPPDFPALVGSRTDLLAGLSRTDLAKLVSTAYNDVPKAIENARAKYTDPAALADRAIERITTNSKLVAKLQQRDPQLAEWVAALPDQAAQATEPKPMLGGDIAAGGGGFGLVAPRLGPTLAGAVGGGALGAGVGAAKGDRGDDLARDAATGVVAGGSLGAVAPSLAATDVGSGYLASLGHAGEKLVEAQSASGGMFPRGTKDIIPAYRVERKTNALVPLRNLIGNAVNTAAAGGVSLADYLRTVSDMYGRQGAYFAAQKAAGGNQAALDLATLDSLPAQWQGFRAQFGDGAVLAALKQTGEDYQPIDQPAAMVNARQGAMRAMLFHTLGPGPLAGLPGYVAAGVRGAFLPFRAQLQTDLTRPIDQGARLAVAGKAIQDALNAGAVFNKAAELGGEAAKRALGDYTGGNGKGILDTLAPGSSWNVQQGRVLGNILTRHPQLATAAAIAAQQGNLPRPDLAQPGHTGTLQFDDQTPGIGLAARALNGGAPGQANVNPYYAFSPVGGEALNLAAELAHPERHPFTNPVQRAADILDAGGVSLNPILGALLHKVGYLDGAPGDPDKAAKIGAAGDEAFRAWVDAHTANSDPHRLMSLAYLPTLASLFSPDGGALDPQQAAQDVLAGRMHSDAVDKAVSEIAYEQTGKPLGDPGNSALVQQTFDPNSPLMKQAKERAGHQLFWQGLAAVGSPVPTSATTQSAHEAAVAHEALVAAGLSKDQIANFEIATGEPLAAVQAQMLADFSKLNTDAARLYAASSPKERGQLMLEYFQAQHQSMSYFAPQYEKSLEGIESERYGLTPPGTLAQQAHNYDLGVLGLRPVGSGPIPWQFLAGTGLPPEDFAKYFHLAPPTESPFPLPPGAGR